MKDKHRNCLRIRYIGSDQSRMFTIQRGDFMFWTGDGFSRILDKAKVYRDHDAAATAVAALQYRQYKGLPVRAFKVELSFLLASGDVDGISLEQLKQYIANAIQISVDNGKQGDGPVDGSFVQARLHLATLEETVPRRTRF
jgi:hypothetical protein